MKFEKKAICPCCGNLLFQYMKGSNYIISIRCTECKRLLKVKIKGGLWNE